MPWDEMRARSLPAFDKEFDGISKQTMENHYKLYQGYVKKTNECREILKGIDYAEAEGPRSSRSCGPSPSTTRSPCSASRTTIFTATSGAVAASRRPLRRARRAGVPGRRGDAEAGRPQGGEPGLAAGSRSAMT